MYIYIYIYIYIYRIIMKVKKHFYLKHFDVSLLQLRFSVLYIYSFYMYIVVLVSKTSS